MSDPTLIKWLAEDQDDLVLVSSALQDAIAPMGEIKFDSKARALTVFLNRFRWELPDYGKGERAPSALRIDSVLSVQSKGLSRSNPQAVAVLLSLEFTPDAQPPGGILRLMFAGGGEMRARVELIDVMLADIGRSRRAVARPDHSAQNLDEKFDGSLDESLPS